MGQKTFPAWIKWKYTWLCRGLNGQIYLSVNRPIPVNSKWEFVGDFVQIDTIDAIDLSWVPQHSGEWTSSLWKRI